MEDNNGWPRSLGVDSESGKPAWAITARGGLLEAAADIADLESATALLAVAEAVLSAGEVVSDAERGAFMAPLVNALRNVVDVAARRNPENPPVHAAAVQIMSQRGGQQ
ncbi:hypothetical protein ACIREM_00825 [Streptomyces shenzhenensis]|uniref:hypothetical protein n=1 Tax=Streptomyces shenzhenensis TaxID=943815 RepID=UPI0037FFECD7